MKNLSLKMLAASFVLFVSIQFSFAQLITNKFPTSGNAGIGTTTPQAALQIASGTIRINQAAMAPPVTVPDTVRRLALAVFDSVGNLIRATDPIVASLLDGIPLPGGEDGVSWKLNGNNGVLATHYLGTINAADLKFRTNSLERMSMTYDGYFNIGLVNALKGMNVSVIGTATTDAGFLVETDNTLGGYGILSNVVNANTKALSVQQNSTESFYVNGGGQGYFAGRLGIGTSSPGAALQITHDDADGGMILNRNNPLTGKSQVIFQQSGVEKWTIGTDMTQDNSGNFFIYDATAALPRIFINAQGNVGIGTTDVGLTTKLAVEGKICAREIKVLLGTFPDYVFEKDYDLMSLAELENYINQHKHLPGMPSAKEVEENKGVDLGEMNRLLLEKVEELTLHLIQLQKEVEALKAQGK